MSLRKQHKESGFSLLETVVSFSILTVGLIAVAGLMANMSGTTTSSRYGGTQTLLASEKLEDLNRLSACDALIAVPNGTSSGSLTSDTSQTITPSATICANASENVNYFDDVQISTDNGGISETSEGVTITQTPNGEVTNTAAPNPSNMMKFHRRWIIEQGIPVAGVRRITVLVTAQTGGGLSEANGFQTSMVRP